MLIKDTGLTDHKYDIPWHFKFDSHKCVNIGLLVVTGSFDIICCHACLFNLDLGHCTRYNIRDCMLLSILLHEFTKISSVKFPVLFCFPIFF